ncbi:MAG: tetratricopeptide repeat protein, partial [Planctomycetota bacterium]
ASRAAAVCAIGLGRVTADVLARLVQIDRERGDVLAALDASRLLTILDASDPDWRRYRAQLLAETGRPSAAEAIYRQALAAAPTDAQSWLGLGNVLATGGRAGAAASAYETAWILGERTPAVAEGIAGLEQRDGNLVAAVRWLERAEALERDVDGRRALRRARLLASSGQEVEALRVAEAVVAAAPSPGLAAEARVLCATLTLRADRVDEALAHMDAARAAGVIDAALEESAGRTLYVRRDFGGSAVRLARAAAAAGDTDPDLLELLASARIRAGDLEEAREAIVAYIERRSMDDAARALVADWRSAKRRAEAGDRGPR